MKIDYDQASKTYDNTRTFSGLILESFSEQVSLLAGTNVLDFGCGTGNYLNEIYMRFGCRCFGVEPSERMRHIATDKNPALNIKCGDHKSIPFEDGVFDFVYMTDVVHHVPDLMSMFGELSRVLRLSGWLCIVTESHEQIDDRFYNSYFPTLGMIEKNRYPDINAIIQSGLKWSFAFSSVKNLPKLPPLKIDAEFIRNVTEKNWSMFRLLSETEFYSGLKQLKSDLGKELEIGRAGCSLIWLKKSK